MPYAYKLLFIANVSAFLVVFRRLAPYGLLPCLGFALVFAYLTIVTGCR